MTNVDEPSSAGGRLEWLRTLAELRRRRRAEREAVRARRRAERDALRARERAARAEWARARRDRLAAAARALRPVAPVAMVTAFAVFGQLGYGFEHYTSPATPWLMKVVIAVGAAVTVESIANYVAWQAHQAQLKGATARAARRRRAAYAIALGVAGVNYAHFAGPGLAPTPGSIVFGLFSASQPWLWGMHTQQESHLLMVREGRVDDAGAVFSAERWRAFPYRTWLARRYSIAHNITDPREAWVLSEAERVTRRAARRARRSEPVPASRIAAWLRELVAAFRTDEARTATAAPSGTEQAPTEEPRTEPSRTEGRTDRRVDARTEQDGQERAADRPGGTNRRRLVPVDTDRENDFRQWAATLPKPPSAYQVRQRYGCRQSVAERLLDLLDEESEKEPEREAVGV